MRGYALLILCLFGGKALAAPAITDASLHGRQPKSFSARFHLPLMALIHQDVTNELNLSAEQKEKVTKLLSEHVKISARLMEPTLAPDAIAGLSRNLQECEDRVVQVIEPAQGRRLLQIGLQYLERRNLLAFLEPDLVEALKITDEQKRKLRALNAAYEDVIFGQSDDSPFKDGFFADYRNKRLAVLTPKQQKQWKEMVGVPFIFRWLQPARREPSKNNLVRE